MRWPKATASSSCLYLLYISLHTLFQPPHAVFHIGAVRCHIQAQKSVAIAAVLASLGKIETACLTDKGVHCIRIRRQ